MMLRDVKTLYRHRELLAIWTLREIKVRYKQSVLGAAWALLQPLALMVAFTIVFSVLVHIPTDSDVPYPAFSYTALLIWTFFASSISFAVPTLVNNLALITKVYFPREVLPIASVMAAFVDFLVASVMLLAVLIWYHIPATPAMLWAPVILIVQMLLILGIVLPVSAFNVFYRDVRFIVPVAIQLWLYATPIIYPVSAVPAFLRGVYALNPMVGIIDSFRRVMLLGQAPDPMYLGTSAAISVGLVVLGYTYFKRSENLFADLV